MTNPLDLWAVWMQGWMRAADGILEAQRAVLQRAGTATERTRQQADAIEGELRRTAETVAWRYRQLDDRGREESQNCVIGKRAQAAAPAPAISAQISKALARTARYCSAVT